VKSLEQLIDLNEPAMALIKEWLVSAKNDCTLLPPSTERAEVLLRTQVTTRSAMGAVAYETGGVLIDHGWLRFLGSGHSWFRRTLPDWNRNKTSQFYLIADDAAGGFFAINGGALGTDLNSVYYWPPDSFEWEAMNLGYSEFFHWALIGDLEKFYSGTRWSDWEKDVCVLSPDRCIDFYPPLWTREGAAETSFRATIPVEEAFLVKTDVLRQMQNMPDS
jgi:hypothetical protein